MKTYEYLNTKEDKESLETIYNRIFKTAESGEFVNQHLINASMNLKAAYCRTRQGYQIPRNRRQARSL